MVYLIEIEVDHDFGKSPRKSIDLSNELQKIGIDTSQLEETYTASYVPSTKDPAEAVKEMGK